MVATITSGVQDGWKGSRVSKHSAVDANDFGQQKSKFSIGSGIALVLLLVNAGFLIWWVSGHINISDLYVTLGISSDTESAAVPSVTTVTVPQGSAQEPAAPQDQLSMIEITPTSVITDGTVISPLLVVITATKPAVTSTPPSESSRDSEATQFEPGIELLITPQLGPLPILIHTPTPLSTVEPLMTVRSLEGANVRKAPDLAAEVFTVLADGTIVPVVGRTEDSQWFLIRINENASGWISTQVVELTREGDNVPVVEATCG
jgi:hypothetical protein